MLGPMARISRQFGRNVMMNGVRKGSNGGIPGENLPFDIHNRKKFTFVFFIYGMTGFTAPFLILQHQMSKQ